MENWWIIDFRGIFSYIFKVIVMEDNLINTKSSKYSLQATNLANINMIMHSVCEKINYEMCCKAHGCCDLWRC